MGIDSNLNKFFVQFLKYCPHQVDRTAFIKGLMYSSRHNDVCNGSNINFSCQLRVAAEGNATSNGPCTARVTMKTLKKLSFNELRGIALPSGVGSTVLSVVAGGTISRPSDKSWSRGSTNRKLE